MTTTTLEKPAADLSPVRRAYERWAEHCKRLAPVTDAELSAHVAHQDRLALAVLDARPILSPADLACMVDVASDADFMHPTRMARLQTAVSALL